MSKYAGRIKSFNPTKGWGFIECSETQQVYGKDIFIMKKALPNGACEKGDTVYFVVVEGPSGPQAAEVEIESAGGYGGGGYGGGGAPNGKAMGSKPYAMARAPSSGPSGRPSTGFLGYVKSYVAAKGWGFVTSEAMQQLYGKDIFFMKTSLRAPVNAGDQVRFTISQGAKGPEATDVMPTGGVPGSLGMQNAYGAPTGYGAAPQRRRVMGAGNPFMPAPSPMLALPSPAPARTANAVGSGQMLFGSMKSYNVEKGWGHIDCQAARDVYGKDVFVMRNEVGDQLVQQGTLVAFRVVEAPKGPHASELRVLPDGAFAMGGNPGSYFEGVVKTFNAQKGWGFVTSEDIKQIFGKDIFLRKQELGDVEQLEQGTALSFTVEVGKTGQLEAKNVSLGEAEGGVEEDYRPVARPSTAEGRRARPY